MICILPIVLLSALTCSAVAQQQVFTIVDRMTGRSVPVVFANQPGPSPPLYQQNNRQFPFNSPAVRLSDLSPPPQHQIISMQNGQPIGVQQNQIPTRSFQYQPTQQQLYQRVALPSDHEIVVVERVSNDAVNFGLTGNQFRTQQPAGDSVQNFINTNGGQNPVVFNDATNTQNQSSDANVVTKYTVNFKHYFAERINPKNPASDWRWSELNGYVADGGTFVRDAMSSVKLSSIPFGKYVSRRTGGRVAGLSGQEAVFVNKQNIVIGKNEHVTARFSFTCKVYNVQDHAFPADVVSKAEDDPTLANCGMSVATHRDTSLIFSIVATNNGIWAVYERNRYSLVVEGNNTNERVFAIFHRLADRRTSDEMIEAGITLDRRQNRVDFHVNNVIVWSVNKLGTLPAKEPGTQMHSSMRQDSDLQNIVDPKHVLVTAGLSSYLDEYDPNNPVVNSLRKVRLVSDPNYYDPDARFYSGQQQHGMRRQMKLFGQGATMTLYDAEITVTE